MEHALWTSLASTAVLLTCSAAHGQIPDKFTNLKVLPKDISKQELQSTMRSFAFALGVRCEHCHVEKKAPEKGFDYSADDKDTKKTARHRAVDNQHARPPGPSCVTILELSCSGVVDQALASQ